MPVDRNKTLSPSFESVWNIEVARGGYLQLPHDFYRNAADMGLTPTDTQVCIYIMGCEPRSYITAASIAKSLGVSVGTIRKTFRKLEKLKYVHRHFQKGGASRFSYNGLKQAVMDYARLRESSERNFDIGITRIPAHPNSNLDTNKEEKEPRIKDQTGWSIIEQKRKELGI